MLASFVSLFYPNLCSACNNSLNSGEQFICTSCRYHLPKTDFHLFPENPLSKRFWGRVPIQSAASFYFFNRGEKVQRLIHNFKYGKHQELGIFLGQMYGSHLKESALFNSTDLIIPVPLHFAKKEKRGFNQSEVFANGLSESMGKKCYDYLKREKQTDTQTKKSRAERWENVKDIFSLSSEKIAETIKGCHVLLVDDVITTGSTLEASITALQKIPKIKISVATIAFASPI